MLSRAAILGLIVSASTVFAQGVGQATWYNLAGYGACGFQNTDADFVVAVGDVLFGQYPGATQNPNLNPICQKSILIKYQNKSVKAHVVDRCGGCKGNDLDLSPAAFKALADPAIGRLSGVSWSYV